eukprot:scaffold5219_cov300-Pinguiococcus_pyrenoidosus.AAC.1
MAYPLSVDEPSRSKAQLLVWMNLKQCFTATTGYAVDDPVEVHDLVKREEALARREVAARREVVGALVSLQQSSTARVRLFRRRQDDLAIPLGLALQLGSPVTGDKDREVIDLRVERDRVARGVCTAQQEHAALLQRMHGAIDGDEGEGADGVDDLQGHAHEVRQESVRDGRGRDDKAVGRIARHHGAVLQNHKVGRPDQHRRVRTVHAHDGVLVGHRDFLGQFHHGVGKPKDGSGEQHQKDNENHDHTPKEVVLMA